ncbi:MAG: lactonase family protein [Tepidisphaeraceae bacterium]
MNVFNSLVSVSALLLIGCAMLGSASAMAQQTVYIASPAGEGTGGIFVATLDLRSGKITGLTRAAEEPGSFIAMHPGGKFMYSVGAAAGKADGVIRAFAIDPQTRKLTLLNEQSTGGRGPCHLAIDPSGKCVIAVNYSGGNFSALSIDTDGKLRPATATIQHEGSGPNPKRQGEPHPHSVNFSPDGKLALIADLGLDQIKVYAVDTSAATVTPHDPPDAPAPAGAGPRHLDFSPDGKFAYVSDEMTSAVTAYAWDGAKGMLTEIQTISTLPDGYEAAAKNTTSEVQAHPSGKFVYVANRGHDTIAAYRTSDNGKLTPIGHTPVQGKEPRHFAIDPSGRWLLIANQSTHNVAVLAIEPNTGGLTDAHASVDLQQPMCVLFVGK